MPFQYNSPPQAITPLTQGEIVSKILELPPVPSDIVTLTNDKMSPSVVRRSHPFVLVTTQDCDLSWDWNFRKTPEKTKKDQKDERKLLPHVQFCELFVHDEIRWNRGFNSTLWRRVQSNQDERYHVFPQAQIGNAEEVLPDLYIDFKRVFSLPTDYVYWLIDSGYSIRKAVVPDPYLRDVVQRLFSYLSRVAIPEDEDQPVPADK
ncbi:MAG: hypothetical protein HYX84_09240 [Chloroflexi bacterium]|nr:hypothetical protein [Chloroflexota bacterium]